MNIAAHDDGNGAYSPEPVEWRHQLWVWGAVEQIWEDSHICSVAPETPDTIYQDCLLEPS